MENFHRDLKEANIEEEILMNKMIASGKYDGGKLKDTDECDIVLFEHTPGGKKYTTVELKHDKYNNDRVAIEVFCKNRFKATGISVTKADWFVILKNDKYYFTRPEQLKNIIKVKHDYIWGGDNNNALMVLVELEELSTISTIKEK